jgi:cell division protein FtsL
MIRAPSLLLWFGLILVASVAFYHTSDKSQALEQQLHGLNLAIENEQQGIHVLKAEWAYLASPSRVEMAAKRHLALRPTLPQQVVPFDNLADALPARSDAVTSAAVISPLANVHVSLAAPSPRPALAAHHSLETVASADTGHVNNRMVIEHAPHATAPATIGALLNQLDANQ